MRRKNDSFAGLHPVPSFAFAMMLQAGLEASEHL